MFLGLSAAIFILLADQLSKYFVYDFVLRDVPKIEVTSFFNIIEAWNTGVSFSMFDGNGLMGVIALSLLSGAIVMFLLIWLKGEKSRSVQLALGFIIGGAIGNVVDRVRLRAVFDFFDFYVGKYHWPTFNVADMFICIGATIIVIHSMLYKKERKKI